MVTRGTSVGGAAGRRGGTLGCLVSLLFFVTAVYYGFHIGEVYWRYYEVLEAMKSEARLARGLTDREIRTRLAWKADSISPGLAPEFSVRRRARPGRITIETAYSERVVLPFFTHTFDLRPRAEEPL